MARAVAVRAHGEYGRLEQFYCQSAIWLAQLCRSDSSHCLHFFIEIHFENTTDLTAILKAVQRARLCRLARQPNGAFGIAVKWASASAVQVY